MLSQADVAQYLLERDLIDARSIVDGDLVVRDVSARNCNFKVERRHAPSYLLKQGVTAEAAATVAHEAAVYEALWSSGASVCRHLPRFHGYGDGVLVVELVGDGRDLREHHARWGRFPVTLAAATGRLLGVLHASTGRPSNQTRPERAPWVLSSHRPGLEVFRDMSAASLEVVKILQAEPALGRRFDELRESWSPEVLLHNDVKWDNFIVVSAPATRRRTLKLVDWEGAGRGDPCWDIGSVFAQYLSFWLCSIPVTGDAPPDEFPALAAYPLEAMQPAMGACWRAYLSARRLEDEDASRCLYTAVELAAARLVQTTLEMTQASVHLNSNAVLHVQLALNMVLRRREAAVHLLGIR